jgi:hypothetical protein
MVIRSRDSGQGYCGALILESGRSTNTPIIPWRTPRKEAAGPAILVIPFLLMALASCGGPNWLVRKYGPALVCIEIHREVRRQIFDYFAEHGYGLLEIYKAAERVNAYFAPLR